MDSTECRADSMKSRIALLDIVELVVKLKKKIEDPQIKILLQGNEALTRYALIDPLLRALGWDTEDPDQVEPEFATKVGKADYALKIDKKPVIIVEAKALGTQLDDRDIIKQVIPYAYAAHAPYIVVTDGNRWEVYKIETSDIVVSWQIKDDSPQEVALKALAIANLGNRNTLGKPGYNILLPRESEGSGETKGTTREGGTIEGPISHKLARKLVLQILAEVDRPMGRKEILDEVKNRVKLTERDLETLKSGGMRWEKIVHGTITRLSKEGSLKKVGENSYVITDKGREELNKL